MTIEWHLRLHPTADILQITGFLGDDAVTRFTGSIGWALARGQGPLLLDLTGLKGWSEAGHAAVLDAARELTTRRRTLELVAPPATPTPDTAPGHGLTVHQDIEHALATHLTDQQEGGNSPGWHTSGWDTDQPQTGQ